MLRSLHVKNLALIRETEVEFGEGLRLRGTQTGRKIEKYGSGTFGGRNSDLKQKTVLGEEHLPY